MWLHYENPCSRATLEASAYPPTVAYCCFQPCDKATLVELARLAIEMLACLHPDWSATFVGFRPYAAGADSYVCDRQFAADLIQQCAGEGYALVPTLRPEDVLAGLQQMRQSEESTLVHLLADRVVCFLHDGHDSLEIIGDPAEIRQCARFLFDRCPLA